MLRKITHTAYNITYRFTFIPKYRKRRLQGEIKKKVEGMVRFCAQINEFDILELSIEPEHVHIVLSAKPMYSPSNIMNLIKGGTSKKLREMYPDLAEHVWGKAFWARGYFVGTVGRRNLQEVTKYVRDQQKVHGTAAF